MGTGSAVLCAIEAAEHFLSRSGCKAGFEMNFSGFSISLTLTPPGTILCSFFFQFFRGPVALLISLCLFCVGLVVIVMSETVGVVIHGVGGSPSPEDQMRYAILLCVCRRYTTSWE